MSNKKGFFNFLKGWSSVSEEEKQQENYAKSRNGNRYSSENEVTDEIESFVIEKFEDILVRAGFSGKVRTKKRDSYKLFLEVFDASEDAGRIIGKGGSTLEALQILLRQFVIRKFDTPIRINIDAADYRDRRISQIKNNALKAADDVREFGESVELEPMNASERRAVHLLFEESDDIETISEGHGNTRRIVLAKRA